MNTAWFKQALKVHQQRFMEATRQGITPDDPAFAVQLTVNGCDGCNMCCVMPAISAEQYADSTLTNPPPFKPYGEKCRLLACDGGCSVYKARPNICTGYLCFYSMGLAPQNPKDSGVAWSLELDMEKHSAWVVVGHTYDCEVMLKIPSVISQALQYQYAVFSGLEVAYVVLRSVGKVIRLKFVLSKGENEGEGNLDYSVELARIAGSAGNEVLTSVESLSIDDDVMKQAIDLFKA